MKKIIFSIGWWVMFWIPPMQAQILWQKSLGGSDEDYVSAVLSTNNNEIIAVGISGSSDYFVHGNHGLDDIWVVKFSPTGDTVWTKCFGGSNNDFAGDIIQTNDGNFLIVGSFDSGNSYSGNSIHSWLIKITPDGDTLWTKTISAGSWFYGATQLPDGSIILTGSTHIDDEDYRNDVYIVKTDASGNVIWSKHYGGYNTNPSSTDYWEGLDWGYDVVADNSGNIYVAALTKSYNNGDVHGNHGDIDIWVLKLNANGDTIWTKCLGGSSEEGSFSDQHPASIILADDGNPVVVGSTSSTDGEVHGNHGHSDIWVVKLSSATGDTLWTTCIGGTNYDYGYSIIKTNDGKYAITGKTASSDGNIEDNKGNEDLLFIEVSDAGHLVLEKTFGGYNYEAGYSITQFVNGDIILGGISSTVGGDVTEAWGGTSDFWVLNIAQPTIGNLPDSIHTCENNFTMLTIPSNYNVFGQWYHNGTLIPGATNDTLIIPNTQQSDAGNYSCVIGSTDTLTTYVEVHSPITVNITGDTVICETFPATLTATTTGGYGNLSYLWDSGTDSSQSITIYPYNDNEMHTVTVTDEAGCAASDSVHITISHRDSVNICIVTVDTASGKCLVIWERPPSNKIVQFNIYKLTGTTTYSLIGTVPWDSMTVYLDSTSNPSAYPHTYKISAVDTCGNESNWSPYHKTILLQASQGSNAGTVNLSWSAYEEESGTFQPEQYYIYRKSIPSQPYFTLIDSMPAAYTSYTDNNAPAGDNYYLVLTDHTPCYPSSTSKEVGGPYAHAISNIDDYSINTYWNSTKVSIPVKITPNPMHTYTTIHYYLPEESSVNLKVVNSIGEVVQEAKNIPSGYQLYRNQLPAGNYLIILSGSKNIYTQKLIIK